MAERPICSIDDCGNPAYLKTLCNAHYLRKKRHGSPFGGGGSRGHVQKFFAETVLGHSTEECLIWPFATQSGYPVMGWGGKVVRINREACMAIHGTPPSPFHQAAHSCGNKLCVNPNHLRWATRSENEKDKVAHGTHNRGERHYNAKLSDKTIKAIKAMAGMSPKDIASELGISRVLVGHVVGGRTWKHVE